MINSEFVVFESASCQGQDLANFFAQLKAQKYFKAVIVLKQNVRGGEG